MFKAKPKLLALTISAALMPASLQAAVLEEVVVTATKRAQSVQDVGIAITAFTGAQLEQMGFTNAQQVTAMAPGVQTLQPNGEANYSVGIRGVVNSDFTTNVQSPAALYIDEVYIILPSLGFGHDPSARHNDGCFMAAFRVEAFLDLERFKAEVTEFAAYLKNTPLAKGFNEIYYPGEIEHLNTQRYLKDGIDVEDVTWDKLTALAEEYGVKDELEL